MSYLHVTIKKSSDAWLCIFKDLSESDLKKKLVEPYKLGKAIYYDGNILSPNEISQIKINETERKHNEELEIVQDKNFRETQEFNDSSSDIFFMPRSINDYEINECGTEVTDKYISSGPGTGTLLTVVADFIKHPLVVRVIGGLLFITVVAYLGLK